MTRTTGQSGLAGASVAVGLCCAAVAAEQPWLSPRAEDVGVVVEAITARRLALEEAADPRQQARLRLELAELRLLALRLDAADTAALVGLPTVEQRRRVETAAEEALALSAQAERDLAGGKTQEAARLALARARALLLLAGLLPEGAQRQRRLAVEAQQLLAPLALAQAQREAQRLTALGLCELFGAPRMAPRDQRLPAVFATDIPVWFDIALTLEAQAPFWRLPDRERIEATLGKALALAHAGQAAKARLFLQNAISQAPAVAANGARQPVWTLRIAETLHRVGLLEADRAPGRASRLRALAQACEAFAWLLELPSFGGMDRERTAARVLEKVAAAEARWPLGAVTPLALLRRTLAATDEAQLATVEADLALWEGAEPEDLGRSAAILKRAETILAGKKLATAGDDEG